MQSNKHINNYKEIMDNIWVLLRDEQYKKARLLIESVSEYQYIDGWLYTYGYCLEKLEEYQLAKDQYIKIKNKQRKDLMGIIYCCEKLKNLKSVIFFCAKIEDYTKDKNILFKMARCYETLGAFSAANHHYELIYNKDTSVFISWGYCYHKQGDFISAEKTFKSILNWKENKGALLGLVLVYQSMGRMDLAKQTLDSMPEKYKNDRQVLTSLARYYELEKNFNLSVKIYNTLLEIFPQNTQAKLGLAMCYDEMKDFSSAKKIYNTIPESERNNAVFLGLFSCHIELGDFKVAKHIFKHAEKLIPDWKENKYVLCKLALYYEKKNKINKAIEVYKSIINYDKNKHVLYNLSAAYVKKGNHQLAINILEKIVGVDKRTLQSLAYCYIKLGSLEKAQVIYQQLLEKFPQLIESYLEYCRFLIKHDFNKFELLFPQYFQKWSYSYEFRILNVEYEQKKENHEKALTLLKEIIDEFPCSTKAYLMIVRHYLDQNNEAEAIRWSSISLKKFSDNHTFLKKIESMMQSKKLIQASSETIHTFQVFEHAYIALTDPIKNVFNHINHFPGTHYLVGGSLLALLEGNLPAPDQDIDIVTTQDCTEALLQKGFKKTYLPFLCTGFIGNIKVDCVYQPNNILFQRDFTIAAIFCDETGKLYDFSGHGLSDVKNKILRTIGNPTTCFEEDFIRLLRALKYIVIGYKPTSAVDQAIRNWTPIKGINYNHLRIIARKHWLHFNEEQQIQYLKLLVEYGLLTKFFGLDENALYLKEKFEQQILLSIKSLPIRVEKVPTTDPHVQSIFLMQENNTNKITESRDKNENSKNIIKHFK